MAEPTGRRSTRQIAGTDYDNAETCQVRSSSKPRTWIRADSVSVKHPSLVQLPDHLGPSLGSLSHCWRAVVRGAVSLLLSKLVPVFVFSRTTVLLQICWDGGELVCCSECPASYHAPCLGLSMQVSTKLSSGTVVGAAVDILHWKPATLPYAFRLTGRQCDLSPRRTLQT